MKNIILMILGCIIITNVIFAQELGFGVGEIYVGTRGLGAQETVSYYMEAEGSIWGGGPYDFYERPFTLNPTWNPDYTFAETPQVQNTIFCSDCFNWPYFRMITLDNPYESFGYGLYKFYTDESDAYFYIDYRDDNYGDYSNCTGNCRDTWVKYEADEDLFYYMPGDNDANDPDSKNWKKIPSGKLLFYYKIKGQSSPSTDEFPYYWQNCLVGTGEYTPLLIWGPNPEFDASGGGYKIFRAVSDYPLTDSEVETEATELDSTPPFYISC